MGAGKTTLIRLAAGLLPRDSGQLLVLGIDAARNPQQIQDRISYMPQRLVCNEDLTVAENIEPVMPICTAYPRGGRRALMPRLMEMTNLGRFQDGSPASSPVA